MRKHSMRIKGGRVGTVSCFGMTDVQPCGKGDLAPLSEVNTLHSPNILAKKLSSSLFPPFSTEDKFEVEQPK